MKEPPGQASTAIYKTRQHTLWLKVLGNTFPVAASQSSDVGKGISANLSHGAASYLSMCSAAEPRVRKKRDVCVCFAYAQQVQRAWRSLAQHRRGYKHAYVVVIHTYTQRTGGR